VPELPDITVYCESIARTLRDRPLRRVRVKQIFFVRTFDPPLDSLEGKSVREVRRLGKRVVLGFEDDLWAVIHLVIAGRFHWKPAGAKIGGKIDLLAFDFDHGSLTVTEAGTQRRASLHLIRGEANLAAHDPGGLDLFAATVPQFAEALRRTNCTVKNALTDPRTIDGIGNSYSDEILHRARLSPLILTRKLNDEEIARLLTAARDVLTEWTDRLRAEAGDGIPEGVTAFRPEMAVHGRFKKPCPVCTAPVQRIRYADNETNYCARCQTGGKLLADRAMSRLLKQDRPKWL
jgi:formamidopyrimidine-DNA glycosylase